MIKQDEIQKRSRDVIKQILRDKGDFGVYIREVEVEVTRLNIITSSQARAEIQRLIESGDAEIGVDFRVRLVKT